MEVARGARSSIEELLCAAGWTGEPKEVRTRTGWKKSILIQMDKMGLASRRPWQEGGSQTSEQDRQRVMFIMLDNFVGGMPSKKTTRDKKSVKEG